MDCGFIRENLFAIAERKLPADLLAEAEAHLRNCQECSRLTALLESFEESVREAKMVEPDPFISTRTMAMLESRLYGTPRISRLQGRLILKPVLVALFLGLAIFAGVLSGRYGYQQHNQSVTVSEAEMLKSELAIDDLASEEPGLMILQ